ncbi:GlxA family transcriptional regulator [Pseudomonas sp. p50]|uniref:GlxA family transcriptional regulator n=1 Tax=Pseudomonas sp. p50(2008) TaxID=2816832 RepID=UPI00188C5819|nr:GlxA family transcriptional regulator [Pseudomonas sp. p50(2008)]MBF4557455.1 GlxA family transcriptional regulator [Pseudomonas sp. p50(2008)]MBH2035884.1 GlxA family transcriptional regulator [Pseudomonadales bacterium]MBH2078750.1 GlxA family transcriptional regulator [Pseudomonadales bacterium]
MTSIAFVVFEGFQSMALAAMPVFEYANFSAGEPLYDVSVLSEHGHTLRASGGLTVGTEAFDERVFDTLIVVGGDSILEQAPAGVLSFLRDSVNATRRTASICSGAFVLAQAGLLEGRRATTHWAYARDLQARYPSIRVEEDRIYVVDGSIWTSAGMTAGIDLALAMVEKDHGAELARSVAQKLVMYHRRAGGQSQHSALLELEPKSDRIQTVLAYAREHLAEALSVEQLADVARLSPRQFSRAFRAETGQSPAKAIENLRLEAARQLLERGRLTLDQIAIESGFSDPRRMREAFLRGFGQPPQVIRRNARNENAA